MKGLLCILLILLVACVDSRNTPEIDNISEHHVFITDSLRTTRMTYWDNPDTTYSLTIDYHWRDIEFADGIWKIFYDESKQHVAFSGHVQDGNLTGEALHYRRNGELAFQTNRDSVGKPIQRFEFDLRGNLKESTDYSDGEIVRVKRFFESGEVSMKYFSLNPFSGYSDLQLEVILDTSGFMTEAFKYEIDTTYMDDQDTGELIEVIQQIPILLDSISRKKNR